MKIFFPEKYASVARSCLAMNLRDMVIWGEVEDYAASGAEWLGFSNYFLPTDLAELVQRTGQKNWFIFHEWEEPWNLPLFMEEVTSLVGPLNYRIISFHTPKDFGTFYQDKRTMTEVGFRLNHDWIGALPFVFHTSAEILLDMHQPPLDEHDFDIFAALSLYEDLTLSQRESFFGYGCYNFYRYVLPRLPKRLRIDVDVSPAGAGGHKYKQADYFEMVRRSRITIHLAGGGAQNDAMYQDLIAGGVSLRSKADFISIFGPKPDVQCLEFDWNLRMGQMPAYEDYDDFVKKVTELFQNEEQEKALRREGNFWMRTIADDLLKDESKIVTYGQEGVMKLLEGDNSMLVAEYQPL